MTNVWNVNFFPSCLFCKVSGFQPRLHTEINLGDFKKYINACASSQRCWCAARVETHGVVLTPLAMKSLENNLSLGQGQREAWAPLASQKAQRSSLVTKVALTKVSRL